MSLWCAMVGEIVIKQEFRKEFGYLFRGEYEELMGHSGPIAEYAFEHGEEQDDDILPISCWTHMDYKDEWKGKYETSYDEETGLFTYGVAYNRHGLYRCSMLDMSYLLRKIAEEVISEDVWDEWMCNQQ